MGVKGLWKLIESCGVPVPLETLEHKILAVDVSIWLHQAVRGFRGPGGAAVANAHLLTLFHRICKLLFYRIRPVFVFDGSVPHLKKQTLASRRLRREVAASKAKVVRERLLTNLLKSQAVRKALGRGGPGPSQVHVARPKKIEKDIFELPPLPEEGKALIKSEDLEDDKRSIVKNYRLPNLHQFEFESEEFKALPVETQHDILSELQDTRKENSWNTLNEMPQESTSFAAFQMGRLMKRRKFQATLDDIREEMRKKKAAEMETEMFGELEKHVSLTQRIASEDAAHSIFIKKIKESSNDTEKVEDDLKKQDKGKSPMKRKRDDFERDFLTELEKQGICCSRKTTDSDADSEDDYYQLGEKDDDNQDPDSLNFDGQALLRVVNNLLDKDGLSQEEILALIKQGNTCESEIKVEKDNGPSTSSSAPGFVYNPDVDSSSDDSDFIEVSETSDLPLLVDKMDTNKDEGTKSVDNVKKVLETKNDSLWIKIVQQKLDDVVHTSNMKKSPKKAILDSRSIGASKRGSTLNPSPNVSKGVSISLDLDVKPLRMEDDIFADIFMEDNMNKETAEKQSPNEKSLGPRRYQLIPSAGSEVKKCLDIPNAMPLATSSSNAVTAEKNDNDLMKKRKKETCISDQEVSINSSSVLHISTADTVSNAKIFAEVGNKRYGRNYPEHENGKFPEEKVPSDTEFMSCSDDSDPEEHTEKINHEGVKPKLEQKESLIPSMSGQAISCETDDEAAVDDVEIISSSRESDSDEDNYNTILKEKKVDSKGLISADKNEGKISENSMTICDKMETEKTDTLEENKMKMVASTAEESSKERIISKNGFKENSNELMEPLEIPDRHERQASDTKDEGTVESPERPVDYSEDELKRLEGELASEQRTLVAQAQKVERISANLNDQMYGESQDLLQLFGIPFIVAPMEAEAQCGFLDAINLTAGTITDDSDIFLFGGSKVYKNFFNQIKHVEFFKNENIAANIGLDREKMITLALLTGSDYTEGIESVGAVSAMEVLSEFPGEGIECLRALKKWWNVSHTNVTALYLSKVKQKMAKVHLPDSFPSEQVYKAYLEPEVDESREKFSWAVPNVDALRQFTMDKFGWNRAKADEILLPVMKKLGVKSTQMRIDSFFTNIKLVKDTKIQSKRMLVAIAKAKGEEPPSTSQTSPRKRPRNPASKNSTKRRKVEEAEEPSDEESTKDHTFEADQAHLPVNEPKRTLLIDPSESSSGPEQQKVKPRSKATRKKKREEEGEASSGPGRALRETQEDVPPPRKLTKEVMFESLLKKQTITQRETEKERMEEKKKVAAELLKKKADKGKKKR